MLNRVLRTTNFSEGNSPTTKDHVKLKILKWIKVFEKEFIFQTFQNFSRPKNRFPSEVSKTEDILQKILNFFFKFEIFNFSGAARVYQRIFRWKELLKKFMKNQNKIFLDSVGNNGMRVKILANITDNR